MYFERHVTRTKENFDAADVEFTEDELVEIMKAITEIPVVGGRYPAAMAVWG